jgi:hypothetical protein
LSLSAYALPSSILWFGGQNVGSILAFCMPFGASGTKDRKMEVRLI